MVSHSRTSQRCVSHELIGHQRLVKNDVLSDNAVYPNNSNITISTASSITRLCKDGTYLTSELRLLRVLSGMH